MRGTVQKIKNKHLQLSYQYAGLELIDFTATLSREVVSVSPPWYSGQGVRIISRKLRARLASRWIFF